MRGEANDCNCFLKLFLLPRKLPTACHCLKLSKFKEQRGTWPVVIVIFPLPRNWATTASHGLTPEETVFSNSSKNCSGILGYAGFWEVLFCCVLNCTNVKKKPTSDNKRWTPELQSRKQASSQSGQRGWSNFGADLRFSMILSPSKDNLDRANVNSSFRHGCFHTFFQVCATLLISRAHPIQVYTHFPSVYCLGYRILNSPLDLYLLVFYSSYESPLAFQSHNCLGHNSNMKNTAGKLLFSSML